MLVQYLFPVFIYNFPVIWYFLVHLLYTGIDWPFKFVSIWHIWVCCFRCIENTTEIILFSIYFEKKVLPPYRRLMCVRAKFETNNATLKK